MYLSTNVYHFLSGQLNENNEPVFKMRLKNILPTAMLTFIRLTEVIILLTFYVTFH